MAASDKKRYFEVWPAALFRHRPSAVYRSRRDGRFAGAKIVAQPGLQASVSRGSNCYTSNGFCPGCVFVGHFSGRAAILEFFTTRKVAELAKRLAQDVAKHYPPAIANNPAQMVSQARLSGILEEVFTGATQFSREHQLGWYKRARLGKDFRWELEELGYDEKFIGTATEGLILCVSRNLSLKT